MRKSSMSLWSEFLFLVISFTKVSVFSFTLGRCYIKEIMNHSNMDRRTLSHVNKDSLHLHKPLYLVALYKTLFCILFCCWLLLLFLSLMWNVLRWWHLVTHRDSLDVLLTIKVCVSCGLWFWDTRETYFEVVLCCAGKSYFPYAYYIII